MSDSFTIKRSVKDSCGQLSDAECGRLFRAMLAYAFDGKMEELRGNEQYAWVFVREMIEDSVTDRRSLTSRANGKKGGRPIEPTSQQNLFELGFDAEKTKERNKEEKSPLEEETKKERTKERNKEEHNPTREETKKEQSIYSAPARVDLDADSAAFDAFWSAYPRRVGKGAARKAFAKAITKVDLQTMLDALERRKSSNQWAKDGGEFVPHPSTWLNQERWEDDLDSEGGINNGQSVYGVGRNNQSNGKQFDIVYDA